jgi:hypothetical protein
MPSVPTAPCERLSPPCRVLMSHHPQTFDGDRTGYGWFRPRRTWRLPRTLRSFQARGLLNPVWPRVPVPALRVGRRGGHLRRTERVKG